MNYWLFILPVSSAFIGWLAIRVFVHVLFRKAIPAKYNGLVQTIASSAASFISLDPIEKKISSPESLQKITPFVEEHVDQFLRIRLKEEMPMISMFVGDKTIDKMKLALLKEIQNLFPQVMQKFAGNLKEEVNVKKLIEEKLMQLNPAVLEKGFYQIAGQDLKKAYWLAALIGFLIGMVQLLIIYFASK